ncbi:MAG TPA: hypothetical protein VLT87_07210 [Thermoanaerobaculia bacterium]|nr:hypothetical protein [Thermoanaerobaculia bacterium]
MKAEKGSPHSAVRLPNSSGKLPDDRRQQGMARLLAAMEKGVVEIGERDWCREDLYNR